MSTASTMEENSTKGPLTVEHIGFHTVRLDDAPGLEILRDWVCINRDVPIDKDYPARSNFSSDLEEHINPKDSGVEGTRRPLIVATDTRDSSCMLHDNLLGVIAFSDKEDASTRNIIREVTGCYVRCRSDMHRSEVASKLLAEMSACAVLPDAAGDYTADSSCAANNLDTESPQVTIAVSDDTWFEAKSKFLLAEGFTAKFVEADPPYPIAAARCTWSKTVSSAELSDAERALLQEKNQAEMRKMEVALNLQKEAMQKLVAARVGPEIVADHEFQPAQRLAGQGADGSHCFSWTYGSL